jgi:hypothetical protein
MEQVAICQFRLLYCSNVYAQNDMRILTSNIFDDDKRGSWMQCSKTLHECHTLGSWL